MTGALLEISDLTKSFGGVLAVSDCTFAVPEGQVVGLIGPNGAGKSTVVDSGLRIWTPRRWQREDVGAQQVGKWPDVISRLGLIRTFQTPLDHGSSASSTDRS